MQQYTVKKNDSLWKISRTYGVTVDAIAAANHLKGRQVHMLRIGQVLKIPHDDEQSADTQLALKFRALDFAPITPRKIKVAHDGKEEEYQVESNHPLALAIRDHSKGLKIWIESIDKQLEEIFAIDILPIGQWNLSIDSRKIKGDGSLQPKKGPAKSTTPSVKETVTHNAALSGGQTQHQQTRAESGAPTHGIATIFTKNNLRLSPGNEQYRNYIIAAAEKYGHTPQSLAALVDAEAAKVKGVWNEKSNQQHPERAQGLAQFFPAAWTDVYRDENSLLHRDCQKLSESALLAKRLEAKYAIDGAASYAAINLRSFEKQTGFYCSILPPDERAKLAYLLHHEGTGGALRLFGKKPALSDGDVTNRLRKQLGDNGSKLKNLLSQYDDDPASAYKGWLFSYIDAKINVNNFIVADAQKFSVAPRKMAEIAQGLQSSTKPPIPKPKPVASATAPTAKSTAPTPTTPISPPQPATATRQPGAPSSKASSSTAANATPSERWHDPLDVCTLRTARLASKKGAMFGRTRSGGTRNHQGIDLVATPGTPIYAVADGMVYSKRSSTPSYAYGHTLVLEVGIEDLPPTQAAEFRRVNPGSRSVGFFYAHLSELPDGPNPQPVQCGDVIGKSGSSGNASSMTTIALGAHLHFEVRLQARAMASGLENRADPLPFIQNCTNR